MTAQPAKPRILIVDDHPANRIAYESILHGAYSIISVGSGHEALDLTLRHEFAVILLDVRMPRLDGFETADLLRKQDGTRHTPIIFMSAFDQDVIQVRRCYIAGATDFVSSPVDEEILKFKVAAYVAIFLRNEALRLQVQQLNTVVQLLQLEIHKHTPTQDILKEKIKQLEGMIEELDRDMSAAPRL